MHVTENVPQTKDDEVEVTLALCLPVSVVLVFLCYVFTVLWRCYLRNQCQVKRSPNFCSFNSTTFPFRIWKTFAVVSSQEEERIVGAKQTQLTCQ